LSSLLAILSYVPFKIVAQGSFFLCIALFVFDPIPPLSRLLSLFVCGLVLLIAKVERNWREGQVNIDETVVIEESKKEQ
jgi:hypothetical protein